MKLAFPHALWLLTLTPLLVALAFVEARNRKRRLQKLGELGLLVGQTVGMSEPRRLALRFLAVGAFVCLVVGLAGPRFGERTELMPRRGLDLVFAVDVSKSMRARDVRPDRLERAKAEISLALGRLGENRVGLIAFAGSAFVQCPLTTDVEAMRAFVEALSPDVAPQGGTALAAGLHTAADLFEAEQSAGTTTAGRLLVVVTDGEDHEGELEKAAERLSALGVRIILIGVGSGLGEPIPVVGENASVTDYLKDREGNTVMTRMTPEVLEKVADLVGGRFVDGTRDPTLGLDHVESQVALLEKRDLEARVRTTYTDRSSWPLGAAFVLLVLGFLWPERRRPRVPARTLPTAFPTGALLFLGLGGFGALTGSPAPARAEEPAGFSRIEPHLVEGLEALRSGDFDKAVEAYRRAEADDKEERAVVEYNVGSALLEKAQGLQKASQPEEGEAQPLSDEAKEELTRVLTEAETALDRARDLSADRALRSDAAMARGNARAVAGDLKGAVQAFRDAIVEKPDNSRARHNLKAALKMMAMQQKPPESSGGGDDENEDKEEGDEEEQDGEQQDGKQNEKQDGDQGEQQDGEQNEKQDGDQGEQQDGEQNEQGKDQQGQDQQGQDQQGQDQQGPNQKGQGAGDEEKAEDPKQEPGGAPPPGDEKGDEKDGKALGQPKDPKDLTKEEARRILDALRQREKPLHPFSMRGVKSEPRRVEKDW